MRLQALEQDIQLAIALKYLAVFNQKAMLNVAEDTNKTLKNLYLDSKNRYEVGLLDKNTVLKFKVDYANADLGVKREEANLRKAINELSREANQSIIFEDLTFSEFSQVPGSLDQNAYQITMLSGRSELKALEKLAASAEAMIKARKATYYPHLDFSTSYTDYEDHYLNGQGEYSDDELRAELTMSINLFNGFADEAAISRAKAEIRSINYQRAELENIYKTDLQNLFVDYEISLANVEVAREDIAYAEENLRITEMKYKEGLQRQLDLLDAVANLTRAQSNYVAVMRIVFANYFQIIRMVEEFPGGKQGS